MLTLAGISKSFPGVRALSGVNLDVRAGRDPRPARRKRSRQVHADQDHRRRLRARRGRNRVSTMRRCAGRRRARRSSTASTSSTRSSRCFRNCRSRTTSSSAMSGATGSAWSTMRERSAKRSELLQRLGVSLDPSCGRRVAVGRRPADGRDRPRDGAQGQAAGARRADGRHRRARGRAAVRSSAPSARQRRLGDLHLASPRGSLRDLRPCHRAEGRPPGRHARYRRRHASSA